MSPLLLAIAAVATAGAVVALAARDGRIATLGLTVGLVCAPLVSDPFPEPAVLAVRVIGALLVAYVLWIGLRETGPATRGSAVGWLALALAGGAAFAAGLAAHSLVTTIETPAAALAAGTALIVLALVPVVRAREAFRLAIGLLTLLLGVTLMRVGLAGSPGAVEAVATAASLALISAAGIVIASLVHAESGDFEFRASEPEPVRRRPTDEAHRPRVHGPHHEVPATTDIDAPGADAGHAGPTTTDADAHPVHLESETPPGNEARP